MTVPRETLRLTVEPSLLRTRISEAAVPAPFTVFLSVADACHRNQDDAWLTIVNVTNFYPEHLGKVSGWRETRGIRNFVSYSQPITDLLGQNKCITNK